MGEIGNIKFRLKLYRINIFRNKKVKIQNRSQEKKKKNYTYYKAPSKPKTILMIIIGFIFAIFENLFEKINNKISKNIKKKTIENNKKHVLKEINNNKLTKLDKIVSNSCKNIENKIDKIENINIKLMQEDRIKNINNNLLIQNTILNRPRINSKIVLKKQSINQKNKQKKIDNKINKNKLLIFSLPFDKKIKLDKKNIQNKKVKIKNLNNKSKKQDVVNKTDILNGISILTKSLLKQEKEIEKINKILEQYNGKIKDKLKINYFFNFINNLFDFIINFFPLKIFKNKMFGRLINSILINNSIKNIRKNIDLKNNATLIVPEYLSQIKKQEDLINMTIEMCEDSLNQFYSTKEEFMIYNKDCKQTEEYKKIEKTLSAFESKIKIDLNMAKQLSNTKKQVEIETNQKVYKIVRKI